MLKIPNYLMQQEIKIENYAGNSAYGAIYSDPIIESGRFEPTTSKVTDYKGSEVVASGRLYLYPYVQIKAQSKVTIDDQIYEAIKVTPLIAFKNAVYIEVMLA